ncbi:hypothetical protein [Sphingobium yanoikuyae]|mgnify:CR=1 FL=1|uniref:hypothetical protein n=1 Tax=Sphingobium yanoikuyae TaxID=13690 RepID=UPI0035C7E283
MIKMTGQSCASCRFIGNESARKRGIFACRRYPPTVAVVVESRTFRKDHYQGIATWSEDTGDVSLWPMTLKGEWCGEYQAAALSEAREE